MSSIQLSTEHRQQQSLSPRLQHAVRLLQMSSQDYTQEVHDVLGKNPFLEVDEGDMESGIEDVPLSFPLANSPLGQSQLEAELPTDKPPPETSEAPEVQLCEGYDEDRDTWQAQCGSATRRNEESVANLMDLHPVEHSLSEHLLSQLCVLPLSPRDLAIAQAIVGSLDDDGYLRCTLSELAEVPNLTPPPDEGELRIALSRIQSLEPAGVGARCLQECLLLQVPDIECVEKRKAAQILIEQHLERLAAKDLPGLGRILSCSVGEVQAILDCIRRLDPHPGWRFGYSDVHYVIPDVIVKKQRGKWNVTLNPTIIPRVRLNHDYVELFQRNRNEEHGDLAAHLHDARWTVSNVKQRFATIISVAQAIIGHQKNFLEYGPLAMKPLGLREIADEIGVHESTVSRVTNNKYMATPLGVFELKYFFSRAMVTASGGECSAIAIRSLINDMIAAETPQAPLCDAEIARQLARQGLVVARRTVTKYRQSLRIESFERRRRAPKETPASLPGLG